LHSDCKLTSRRLIVWAQYQLAAKLKGVMVEGGVAVDKETGPKPL